MKRTFAPGPKNVIKEAKSLQVDNDAFVGRLQVKPTIRSPVENRLVKTKKTGPCVLEYPRGRH